MKKILIDLSIVIALFLFMLSICMLDSENYIIVAGINILSMLYLTIIAKIKEGVENGKAKRN